MAEPIKRTDPVMVEMAKVVGVPVERIEHWIIVVQYDTGVAMLHTLCCQMHARQGLAMVAATPPDITVVTRFTGSN